MEKETAYLRDNSKLMADWNYEKNRDLNPYELKSKSNKKVYWKCHVCGYEWCAVISSRTIGNGCPQCSGKVPVKGKTDLATTHPHLAEEWDYEKNGTLTPSDVKAGSGKRVWWKCKICGGEWDAVIYSRSSGSKSGCPYCSGKRPLKGKTDLATTHPHLAEEWNYEKNGTLTPSMVPPGSKKKVWWVCEKGHEWKATIYSRSGKNAVGCPKCAEQLHTSFPEQAIYYYLKQFDISIRNREIICGREVDIFLPSLNTAIEYDGLYYLGDVIQYLIKELFGKTTGQINVIQDKQKILESYKQGTLANSLGVKYPELAIQWHPTKNGTLSPESFSPGSHEKIWWACPICGNEWEATIKDRVYGGRCPVCVGKKVNPGVNDIATTHPELVKEWHPTKNGTLTPSVVSRGKHTTVWWICEKGHDWEETVAARIRGRGCPYCANKRVWKGFNDLATVNPRLAEDWHPTKNEKKPDEVVYGSSKKAWWKCKVCGHEWEAVIVSRNKGIGCPECAKKKRKESLSRKKTLNGQQK